jgi:aminoglycoside phosphotransferase family enzyme
MTTYRGGSAAPVVPACKLSLIIQDYPKAVFIHNTTIVTDVDLMTMTGEPPQGQRLTPQAKVALLQQTQTYPDRPARIDLVETHMSWVFLTDRYAYKLKKPVRYEFLDFSTLQARHKNCLEEVPLNQRLARNVYLGIVPLTVDAQGKVRLEGTGEVIDWLVKMRRLPAERMLDYLIRQQTVATADIQQVALLLCAFYQRSAAVPVTGDGYRSQFAAEIRKNLQQLADPVYGLPGGLVEAVHKAQLTLLTEEPTLFDQRVREGMIIEGHGDLRPEHICLEREPVIFDCLEFNRQFRILDRVDELAFLAMECEHLGAAFIDRLLFDIYREKTGDNPPQCLVNFYKAYRACLRARLAICHTHELAKVDWPKWQERANAYLSLAGQYSSALA